MSDRLNVDAIQGIIDDVILTSPRKRRQLAQKAKRSRKRDIARCGPVRTLNQSELDAYAHEATNTQTKDAAR